MGKLSKQIEAAMRRRAKHPHPQADQLVKLRVSNRLRDVFTQQHAPILLLVESAIVQVAGQMEEVDDASVELALRASIRSRSTDDLTARSLAELLEQVRLEHEIDTETWQTALRVIYTSVTNRSDCRAGDRNYLHAAAEFVRRARSRK